MPRARNEGPGGCVPWEEHQALRSRLADAEREITEWCAQVEWESDRRQEAERERDETRERLTTLRHTTVARLCHERDLAQGRLAEESRWRKDATADLAEATGLLAEAVEALEDYSRWLMLERGFGQSTPERIRLDEIRARIRGDE